MISKIPFDFSDVELEDSLGPIDYDDEDMEEEENQSSEQFNNPR